MSLSRCSSWPKLSLYYTEINIMHAAKTLYSYHVWSGHDFARRRLHTCCVQRRYVDQPNFRDDELDVLIAF